MFCEYRNIFIGNILHPLTCSVQLSEIISMSLRPLTFYPLIRSLSKVLLLLAPGSRLTFEGKFLEKNFLTGMDSLYRGNFMNAASGTTALSPGNGPAQEPPENHDMLSLHMDFTQIMQDKIWSVNEWTLQVLTYTQWWWWQHFAGDCSFILNRHFKRVMLKVYHETESRPP